MVDAEIVLKRVVVIFFILIVVSSYGFTAWQRSSATVKPTLSFKEAASYEFGFSRKLVSVEDSSVDWYDSSGIEIDSTGYTIDDNGNITINGGYLYPYWKMITNEKVTISLKVNGPLDITSEDLNIENNATVPFILEWESDDGNTITLDSSGESVLKVLEVDSIALDSIDSVEVRYSFGSINIDEIFPTGYSTSLTMSVSVGT